MCAFTRRFVDDFEIKRVHVCERTLYVCVCSHECVFVCRHVCARTHCFSGYIFSNRKPWVFSDVYSHYLLVSSLYNGQFSYVFDSLLKWVLFFLIKSFLIVNTSTKRRNFAKDLVTSINCIYASSLLDEIINTLVMNWSFKIIGTTDPEHPQIFDGIFTSLYFFFLSRIAFWLSLNPT